MTTAALMIFVAGGLLMALAVCALALVVVWTQRDIMIRLSRVGMTDSVSLAVWFRRPYALVWASLLGLAESGAVRLESKEPLAGGRPCADVRLSNEGGRA